MGLGSRLSGVVGRGASRLGPGTLPHERAGGGVRDAGGAPCWELLLPGLGWLGPEVVEEVLGGWGLRCRCGARLGLPFGLGSGPRPWCVDGFGWLLGGGLGFWPGCGCGFRWGVGLGGGGGARGGDEFGGLFGMPSPRLGAGVLDKDVVVVADEVVVAVEVLELEAEERNVGVGGGSRAVGGGVGCWVL